MVMPSCDIQPPPQTQQPKIGIENRADEKFAEQKRPEGDALADGADDDVAGRFHEHDFEERQALLPAS